jgi:uncharacterized membrane protein (UPF0127 family)
MAMPTTKPEFSVRNADRGTVLATRARLYASFWKRFAGLMMRSGVPEGGGILLTKSSSIHALFMRFRFDAIFMDDEGRVTKVVQAMRPWTIAFGGKGAKHTLELAAGAAERSGTVAGDRLVFEDPIAGETP